MFKTGVIFFRSLGKQHNPPGMLFDCYIVG